MTSPDILDSERKRILDRCWVYVGHESEVEQPGDYRRRTVAGQPLFMVRGRDGQVRVFLNSVPPPGGPDLPQGRGKCASISVFLSCLDFLLHRRTYRRPGEDAYGPNFDKSELSLKSPPRVDSYRGLYFVSFNSLADDLVTYLAGARTIWTWSWTSRKEG